MKIVRRIAVVVIILVLFIEYSRWLDRSFIYSPDKKQCVTLLSDGDSDIVIPGKYYGISRPSKNFIKGNIRGSVRVRWNYRGYDVIFHNDCGAKNTVNLDTLRYKYIDYKRGDYSSSDSITIQKMTMIKFYAYWVFGTKPYWDN